MLKIRQVCLYNPLPPPSSLMRWPFPSLLPSLARASKVNFTPHPCRSIFDALCMSFIIHPDSPTPFYFPHKSEVPFLICKTELEVDLAIWMSSTPLPLMPIGILYLLLPLPSNLTLPFSSHATARTVKQRKALHILVGTSTLFLYRPPSPFAIELFSTVSTFPTPQLYFEYSAIVTLSFPLCLPLTRPLRRTTSVSGLELYDIWCTTNILGTARLYRHCYLRIHS